MPNKSYMPKREVDQVAWSAQVASVVGESAAEYGVPTAVMTAFNLANTNLQGAWQASQNMATRTQGTVAAKNTALDEMKVQARSVVGYIQATPTVTDQMKIDAGITVRSDKPTPAPIPPKPFIKVTCVDERNVTIEICQNEQKRGKPARTESATILTATGPTCPMSMDGFTYLTVTGKSTLTIPFPPSETGDTVWITAFWTNTAKVAGPAAMPMKVNLAAGGNLQSAGAESPNKMKMAA